MVTTNKRFSKERAALIEAAERRYASIVASGETVGWPEMRQYLERRISGSRPRRPKSRPV